MLVEWSGNGKKKGKGIRVYGMGGEAVNKG